MKNYPKLITFLALLVIASQSQLSSQSITSEPYFKIDKKLVFISYEELTKRKLKYHSKVIDEYIDVLEIGLEKDGNLSRRLEAAQILGRTQSKESVALLHKTLSTTTHPSLRSQCIDSLARINDPLSAMYLENALKDEGKGGTLKGKPFVKSGLKAIEQAKKKNKKSLAQFPSKEEYLRVKRVAAWALGIMARNRSIIVLANALNDKDLETVVNAAHSLGEIANPGTSIEKKSSTVRDHIKDIISKFNNKQNSKRVRIALAYPMLKLRENERRGFYFLAKSLLSDDGFTRALAAKVLGRLHDIRGLSPLEDAVQRERSQWVEKEMQLAIRQIKMFNKSYR